MTPDPPPHRSCATRSDAANWWPTPATSSTARRGTRRLLAGMRCAGCERSRTTRGTGGREGCCEREERVRACQRSSHTTTKERDKERLDAPYRGLAKQVILELHLAHLALAHLAVLGREELAPDREPRLALPRSCSTCAARRRARAPSISTYRAEDVRDLAAAESGDALEVGHRRVRLGPEPDEELDDKGVQVVEAEEVRRGRGRGRGKGRGGREGEVLGEDEEGRVGEGRERATA